MPNLKKSILLIVAAVILACSTSKDSTKNAPSTFSLEEGFQLTHNHDLPFDSTYKKAVVKVLSGNSVIGNASFISENGLLLSNYDPVLIMASISQEHHYLLNGFSASNYEEEIPLPGLSILILQEEKDVTETVLSGIPPEATNTQIAQIKREITQNLIQESRAENPNLFVQVTELFGGNTLILSKYLLFNDVRLVWSEQLSLNEDQLADSELLYESASAATALLRVYSSATGVQEGFNSDNQPFASYAHFKIAKESPENSSVIALGFPESTFRASPARALSFYREVVNPSIINSYRPLLAIQDSISTTNSPYLFATLHSRFSTLHQIRRYTAIQEALAEEPIIEEKELLQQEYMNWVELDSTLSANYRMVFTSINQAYDIAEQNGASFYNISYANQLNQLDDLVLQAKLFIEQSMISPLEVDLEELKRSSLENMTRIRNSIDINTELNYLSHTLATLKSLPASQQLPSLEGVFSDESALSAQQQALHFLERQQKTTFLFDAEATEEAFNSDSFYSDSLFAVLDELLFINDMNRNNHAIFLSYLQPVQQVLNAAYLDFLGTDRFLPDANGTLRFNVGYLDASSALNGGVLTTSNDFSANAKGSAVFSPDGTLFGIVSNSTKYIASNYRFSNDYAYLKSISLVDLYTKWNSSFSTESWFIELND